MLTVQPSSMSPTWARKVRPTERLRNIQRKSLRTKTSEVTSKSSAGLTVSTSRSTRTRRNSTTGTRVLRKSEEITPLRDITTQPIPKSQRMPPKSDTYRPSQSRWRGLSTKDVIDLDKSTSRLSELCINKEDGLPACQRPSPRTPGEPIRSSLFSVVKAVKTKRSNSVSFENTTSVSTDEKWRMASQIAKKGSPILPQRLSTSQGPQRRMSVPLASSSGGLRGDDVRLSFLYSVAVDRALQDYINALHNVREEPETRQPPKGRRRSMDISDIQIGGLPKIYQVVSARKEQEKIENQQTSKDQINNLQEDDILCLQEPYGNCDDQTGNDIEDPVPISPKAKLPPVQLPD